MPDISSNAYTASIVQRAKDIIAANQGQPRANQYDIDGDGSEATLNDFALLEEIRGVSTYLTKEEIAYFDVNGDGELTDLDPREIVVADKAINGYYGSFALKDIQNYFDSERKAFLGDSEALEQIARTEETAIDDFSRRLEGELA